MQGRLREEKLTFEIDSSCACCGRTLGITMDGQLNYQLALPEATPLVFMPLIDWDTFSEPNIIHAY